MQSLMMTLSRTIVFSMITFLGSMTLAGMEPLKPNSQTLLVIAQESKSDGSLKPVICQHNFDVRPDRLTITDDFKLNIPEKNAPSSKKPAKVGAWPVLKMIETRFTNETILSPQFQWRSSKRVEVGEMSRTTECQISKNEIFLTTTGNKMTPTQRKISFQGPILPYNSLSYFFYYHGRGPIGVAADLNLFIDERQELVKVSYVYLGTRMIQKKKIYRFEIKGGLTQIMSLEQGGRIFEIINITDHFRVNQI